MIEIGTVKEKRAGGRVVVGFGQLQTEAECVVVQATTGENCVFVLPAVGTQVVCWLEAGKNVVLGAVFSEAETVPDAADPNGEYRQFGSSVLELKEGTAGMKQGNAILELAGEKATLRNGETDLKSILKEFATALKGLTVSTAMGPSGTPLPQTVQAVTKIEQLIGKLFR
ncbi:MAG: hypothetical protein ACLUER_00640 [Odoribacter splanchnicus]